MRDLLSENAPKHIFITNDNKQFISALADIAKEKTQWVLVYKNGNYEKDQMPVEDSHLAIICWLLQNLKKSADDNKKLCDIAEKCAQNDDQKATVKDFVEMINQGVLIGEDVFVAVMVLVISKTLPVNPVEFQERCQRFKGYFQQFQGLAVRGLVESAGRVVTIHKAAYFESERIVKEIRDESERLAKVMGKNSEVIVRNAANKVEKIAKKWFR